MISMTTTTPSTIEATTPRLMLLAWVASWALLEFSSGICVHGSKDASRMVWVAVAVDVHVGCVGCVCRSVHVVAAVSSLSSVRF